MFKREKKVQLEITYSELRTIRHILLAWRDRLISQGLNADPVNELLTKLVG